MLRYLEHLLTLWKVLAWISVELFVFIHNFNGYVILIWLTMSAFVAEC